MARPTPVVLATTNALTLTAAEVSATGSLRPQQIDAGRLVNTYRDPIRIREIVFSILAQPDTDQLNLSRGIHFGGLLHASLATASRAITNGPVPVSLLAAPITGALPTAGLTSADSECRLTFDYGVSYQRVGAGSFYRWILPQPLDLAPGQAISGDLRVPIDYGLGEVMTAAGIAALALDVTVSLLGHFSQVAPAGIRPVPYASAFTFQPGGPKISDSSDLGNPFAVPLNVHRIAGRQPTVALSAAVGITDGYALGFDAFDSTRLTMRGPGGYSLVRDPTPFGKVFSAHRRGWDVGGVLRNADDYFQITLVDDLAADVAGTLYTRAQVGLIGSRMERF